jgi:molybdopterin molybdotransferase
VYSLFHVKTPEEVLEIINSNFSTLETEKLIPLAEACGRTCKENIIGREYVPEFNRSTVDGYAVRAADTFGCSDSIPALLPLAGEILMGQAANSPLQAGTCVAVATGGAVPEGADAVVMLEFTEDYGDGTIGILKPAAPGNNLIFKGDDVAPGKIIIPAGHILEPHDIGSLAAMGITSVKVSAKPIVGIISTGDELVEIHEKPKAGQVRNVNSHVLEAMIKQAGGKPRSYGIIRDDEHVLACYVAKAVSECDIVIISGGSSVGMRDATAKVIEESGSIILHGIAMKPGKPTILGLIDNKPVFGLPGHPVAAYLTARLYVCPLMAKLMGSNIKQYTVTARMSEAISSNHGRAEFVGVLLESVDNELLAHPIRGKSGLITSLAASDGYICIPRDCEGLTQGTRVSVNLWKY